MQLLLQTQSKNTVVRNIRTVKKRRNLQEIYMISLAQTKKTQKQESLGIMPKRHIKNKILLLMQHLILHRKTRKTHNM